MAIDPVGSITELGLIRDIVLFAIGVAGVFVYWLRSRQATSWPSTQGTVWQAEARQAKEVEERRSLSPWVGQFTYSYAVNGEYYSGTHMINALTKRRAEQIVAGWKDRTIAVRYSPSRSDVSIVLK